MKVRQLQIAALAGVTIMLVSAGAVFAAPAQTSTTTVHQIEDFGEVDIFCSHNVGTAWGDDNGIYHVTDRGDGFFEANFRFEGWAHFTPYDPTQPTIVGHYSLGDRTITGKYGVSEQWTYVNHGIASDGTSFKFEETYHLGFTADGVVLTFDKVILTCL